MQLTAIILLLLLSITHCSGSLIEPEQSLTQTPLNSENQHSLNQADSLFFSDPKTIDKTLKAIELYSKIENVMAYWKCSRAYAYLAEISNDDDKSKYSEKGISFAKKGVQADSSSAESYYYLALNLGHYSDVNRFEALSLLSEMEQAALKSIQLNPKLDHGGAYLFLGLLYYEAPGFTIGNTEKGLSYLEKACSLFPLYPPNLLHYAKVLYKENQIQKSIKYLKKILTIQEVKNENAMIPKWKKEAEEWLKKLNEK